MYFLFLKNEKDVKLSYDIIRGNMMNSINKIPIKNIYYMLCYSWNTPFFGEDEICGIEKFDNIHNLMAKIFIERVSRLVRRGFKNEYNIFEEALCSVRGRVDIGQSINKMSFVKKQLVCNFYNVSENMLFYGIIKATIQILMKNEELDKDLRKELLKLNGYFNEVRGINLSKQVFKKLEIRNVNENYRIIMNICELIFNDLIVCEGGRDIRFLKFMDGSNMNKLYEKFVLNFFKKHLSKEEYIVHSPKIYWNVESYNLDDKQYLPEMHTDIVLESKSNNAQLIIDTKFYGEIFSRHNFGNKLTYRSENMYQIFTYLNNSLFKGKKMAMLLYPTTDIELDKKHRIGGKDILVKTLNLAEEWEKIQDRLMGIADILSG